MLLPATQQHSAVRLACKPVVGPSIWPRISPIPPPFAMSAGGETTVTVTGGGKGGRNQEMALAFALAAEEIGLPTRWLFLSAGTDGRDGPTDAAGGIVTPQSLGLMREAGIDPRAALADNNAHAALASANALLVSGPTGTNVADLQLLLVAPPPF